MYNYNNFRNTKVYTQRGLIPINEVVPTDYVYEFNTGKLLQVQSIHKHMTEKLYEVKFYDGRTQIIDRGDFIYNPHHFSQHIGFESNFISRPVIPCKAFNLVEINSEHDIDPYMIGMLSIYGDRTKEYVNIKSKFTDVKTNWHYRDDITYGTTEDGVTYLLFSGKQKTWNEYAPCMKSVSHTLYGYIPEEYFFDTIAHRWQLVRGIFDTGYDIDLFTDTIGIKHDDINALFEVKELLLSLGVISIISDDKGKYRLDVMDTNQANPNFFYCHDYITHVINIAAESIMPLTINNKIIDIREVKHGCLHPRAIVTDIITCVKNAVYVGENFLPRISK